MPVTNQTQTAEEKQQQDQEVADKKKQVGEELTDNLLSTLDLPEKKEPLNDMKEGGKVEPKTFKDEEEEEVEEQVEEEEEEDVVPRSKMQRRIDAEVARRKALEERLMKLEATKEVENTRRAKLEEMSESKLKDLKKQVRSEWKRTEDADKENQLVELEDEIDEVLRLAPKRFEQKQTSFYQETARNLLTDPRYDHIDFEKNGNEIRKIATQILQTKPKLNQMLEGHGIALELAIEHYDSQNKVLKASSKAESSKRQATKLKQKTALDSGAVKGQVNKSQRQKLYEDAKRGGFEEKLKFVSEAVLDVDKYLPSELR